MKSAAPKKPASAKSANSGKKAGAKLYLVQTEGKPADVAPSKSRAGDMDFLERYEEKPMPAVFEQIDRTCKKVHRLVGWPFAIV